MTTVPPLILGSTSPYRRELLQRLRLRFDVQAPRVDEAPRPGEAPAALAVRLALAKAHEVASRFRDAVVIGADQVAELDGLAVGKPGTHERAVSQLRQMSGREVIFQTALAVVRHGGATRDGIEAGVDGDGDGDGDGDVAFERFDVVPVRVRFRCLVDDEIEHYLRTEQPYDCAGSAKAEALGIALLDRVDSDDPTALIGLPLIRTCRLLRAAGIDPLKPARAG